MFKQKKLSLGARFGLYVASFVLGLLLFFTAIATALIADVQIVTSQDGISGIFRTMMSAPAQVRPHEPVTSGEGGLRVAPRVNRNYQMPRRDDTNADADAAGDVAADLTEQVIGMFYEAMGDMFGEEMTFTQEEFTQMVNESTVKDYIADKTAALVTDYLNDEITTTFEVEEVVELIHENSELIESITGEPIPDDISEKIGQAFDENEIIVKVEAEGLAGFMELMGNPENPEGEEGASSGGILELLEMVKEYYGIFSPIASTQNLIIGIVICLVLVAAIVLINCRQLGKGLCRAGYPLMLAGSAVILNILAIAQPDMWVVTAGDNEAVAATTNTVLKLVRHILSETAVVNIVVFGTGLVLCIAGIVLGIVLRPKKSPVSVPITDETQELAAAIVDETPVEVSGEVAEEETVAEEMTEEAVEETAPVGE